MTCQSVPLTSIDRWAVKAGDFDAPFAVQGGVCVVKCHLNAQENSYTESKLAVSEKKRAFFRFFSEIASLAFGERNNERPPEGR